MFRVGFSRELAGARPDDPSLHYAPRVDHPDRERLVEYLARGEPHVVTPGVVRDVLRPSSAFRLTRSTREEALFENPSHDFPSRLAYRRRGDDGLSVRAEGASRTLLFELSRVTSAGTDPPPIRMRQRPLDASFRCDEIERDRSASADHATVRFVGNTSGDQGQLVEVGLALSFDSASRRCVAQIASCERGTMGEGATCDGDPLCVRFAGEHVSVERAGRVVFRDLVPIARYEIEGAIECSSLAPR